MRSDLDSFLLDRLFQPVSDRVANWISCFGLARMSLAAALILQFTVVTADMERGGTLAQSVVEAGITVLALVGAQQAWRLIARTERQSSAGSVNVRRITLRWQRFAWLAVTVWSGATGVSAEDVVGLLPCGASVAWLGLVYFVSCTPSPPPESIVRRQAFA